MPQIYDINENNQPIWKETVLPTVLPWPKTIRKPRVSTMLDSYVELPAFNIQNGGLVAFGNSYVIQQYNYTASLPFSFKSWQAINVDNVGNYLLVVKWRVGSIVTRYKLWDFLSAFQLVDEGSYLHLTHYNGQIVPVNFSLEVWTYPSYGFAQNVAADKILLSIMYRPENNFDFTQRVESPVLSSIGVLDGNAFVFQTGFTDPIALSSNISFNTN